MADTEGSVGVEVSKNDCVDVEMTTKPVLGKYRSTLSSKLFGIRYG